MTPKEAEMRGLKEIIGATGALHGIEELPYRQNFADEATYKTAFQEWYRRVNYWHVEQVCKHRFLQPAREPICPLCGEHL